MHKGKRFIFLLLLGTIGFSRAHALPFADGVESFAGGAGFGVIDLSGGAYAGASGSGVFDPSAVTALDGAALGLGGNSGTPGELVVSFATGAVVDLAGPDLRLYDTFGMLEGFVLEASSDGAAFVAAGTFAGDFGQYCSLDEPCVTEVDLLVTELEAAAFFRLTALPSASAPGGAGCVSMYPECYDLDALEAVHFRPGAELHLRSAAKVPAPASLALLILGLGGVRVCRARRS